MRNEISTTNVFVWWVELSVKSFLVKNLFLTIHLEALDLVLDDVLDNALDDVHDALIALNSINVF